MLGASSVSESGCKMTKVKRRTALVEKVKDEILVAACE